MIDLHVHSNISDGSTSPAEVIELAHEAKCTAISLTDHDTFAGIPEATKRAEELDIELVPGIELSCTHERGTMHMLVYFCQDGDSPLGMALTKLQEARLNRNHKLVELMVNDGVDISYEHLVREAGNQGMGRPHFAAILVQQGLARNVDDAFDKFLNVGKKYYINKETFSPKDIILLALQSGGLPVLAHPNTTTDNPVQLSEIVEELTSYGLVGLETYYGRYTPTERMTLLGLARANSLIPTGGSDFHGSYKPDLQIAIGRGDLKVPPDTLDHLKSRHKELVTNP